MTIIIIIDIIIISSSSGSSSRLKPILKFNYYIALIIIMIKVSVRSEKGERSTLINLVLMKGFNIILTTMNEMNDHAKSFLTCYVVL